MWVLFCLVSLLTILLQNFMSVPSFCWFFLVLSMSKCEGVFIDGMDAKTENQARKNIPSLWCLFLWTSTAEYKTNRRQQYSVHWSLSHTETQNKIHSLKCVCYGHECVVRVCRGILGGGMLGHACVCAKHNPYLAAIRVIYHYTL